MPQLEMLAGLEPGRRYPLASARNILGRHPDCDLVLDSASVSRQHAQILHTDGIFFVEDLGSRNGTFVNSRLVQGRQKLFDGDRLTVCDLTFQFLDDRPGRTVSPAQTLDDTAFARALLVDDEDIGHSTITTKLDVSSSYSGIRLGVNPQVKLKALLEITQSLANTLSVDEVLPRLLDSLFKIFAQADRGFIVLRSPTDGMLIPKAVKHRRATDDDTIRISRTIVGQVMSTKKAILSADAATDERFEMSDSIVDFRIRSMMCAPIINSDGTALGIIQIDTLDQRSRFQEDDLEVLAGVASQAAIAIENAKLHEQLLTRQTLERDLDLARRMQQSLLPAAPPRLDGYRFFDYYQAAREVGGDYYDYIQLSDGKLGVVLADVSGKGISAALLMAKLSSEVPYCLASEPSPALAIRRLNTSLCRSGWDDRFVTLVLTVIDPRAATATVVNAGHMPPLLRHGEREVREIGGDEAGPPLGVADDYGFEQSSVTLAKGDFVTLYTDGISEAMNPQQELYGLGRLRKRIGAPINNVVELGRHILDDVRSFVGDQSQSDDMCLACFGRDE